MKNFSLAALLFAIFSFSSVRSQVKILFDATHAQSAANADWVIDADQHNMGWNSTGGYTCSCASNESNAQRYPVPTQTAVTASTAENYWDGALSHWAIDCVNKGYWVETLPFGTTFTYGNTSNAQDLTHYNILVVDEPNTLFTTAEKTALMHFVQNGGSLFMISDHDVSDRNGDGYDSPYIWNDFISNNGVSNNSTGFKFALQNFSGTFTNVVTAPSDSLLHGPYGNVTKVQWSGGTCMNIYTSQNSSVKAVVYKNGVGQADTAALVVHTRVGCGKIAAMSDSSPMDDGTGDPNDNSLYDGYITDAAGNHQKLLMNAMVWLAQKDCSTGVSEMEGNSLSLYPNPSSGRVTINLPATATVRIFNAQGQEVSFLRSQTSEGTILDGLAPGVYTCYMTDGERITSKKLVMIP